MLRAAMAVAFVVILAGIVITQSMLKLVGTVIAVGVYVPRWAHCQWRANPTSILGPTVLLGAPLTALMLLGVVFSSHTLSTRIFGGGAQAASNAAPVEQRHLAEPKIVGNPIGPGLGQSNCVLGFADATGGVSVDNYYLNVLLDLGVPEALDFYGMFVVGAVLGVRTHFRTGARESELAGSLAVVCVVFLVVKSVLSEENSHAFVILLLGMRVALWAREWRLFDPAEPFPLAPRTH